MLLCVRRLAIRPALSPRGKFKLLPCSLLGSVEPRRADEAVKRLREGINYLCEYKLDRGYGLSFALEAKPNEPRADIYMATTGHYLGFIPILDHPEMVGVNPQVAHEHMAGLNFTHAVAQAWDAGKLFHIDLNDQMPGAVTMHPNWKFIPNPEMTFDFLLVGHPFHPQLAHGMRSQQGFAACVSISIGKECPTVTTPIQQELYRRG